MLKHIPIVFFMVGAMNVFASNSSNMHIRQLYTDTVGQLSTYIRNDEVNHLSNSISKIKSMGYLRATNVNDVLLRNLGLTELNSVYTQCDNQAFNIAVVPSFHEYNQSTGIFHAYGALMRIGNYSLEDIKKSFNIYKQPTESLHSFFCINNTNSFNNIVMTNVVRAFNMTKRGLVYKTKLDNIYYWDGRYISFNNYKGEIFYNLGRSISGDYFNKLISQEVQINTNYQYIAYYTNSPSFLPETYVSYRSINYLLSQQYDTWQDTLVMRFNEEKQSGTTNILDTIDTMAFIRSEKAISVLEKNLTILPQTNDVGVVTYPSVEALIKITPPIGRCFTNLNGTVPETTEEEIWLYITARLYPEALQDNLERRISEGDEQALRIKEKLN